VKRFKRILFVINGGANVKAPLKRALALAKNNQAELTVLDVLTPPPAETMKHLEGVSVAKLEDMLTAQRRTELDKLAALGGKKSVSLNTKVVVGIPFIEIIKEVLRNQHDLVMKQADGTGGDGAMLFGSTDLHLIRKCPCPVWISKPTKARRYSRIMAASDPDPSDEEKNKLNTYLSLLEGQVYAAHRALKRVWERLRERPRVLHW